MSEEQDEPKKSIPEILGMRHHPFNMRESPFFVMLCEQYVDQKVNDFFRKMDQARYDIFTEQIPERTEDIETEPQKGGAVRRLFSGLLSKNKQKDAEPAKASPSGEKTIAQTLFEGKSREEALVEFKKKYPNWESIRAAVHAGTFIPGERPESTDRAKILFDRGHKKVFDAWYGPKSPVKQYFEENFPKEEKTYFNRDETIETLIKLYESNEDEAIKKADRLTLLRKVFTEQAKQEFDGFRNKGRDEEHSFKGFFKENKSPDVYTRRAFAKARLEYTEAYLEDIRGDRNLDARRFKLEGAERAEDIAAKAVLAEHGVPIGEAADVIVQDDEYKEEHKELVEKRLAEFRESILEDTVVEHMPALVLAKALGDSTREKIACEKLESELKSMITGAGEQLVSDENAETILSQAASGAEAICDRSIKSKHEGVGTIRELIEKSWKRVHHNVGEYTKGQKHIQGGGVYPPDLIETALENVELANDQFQKDILVHTDDEHLSLKDAMKDMPGIKISNGRAKFALLGGLSEAMLQQSLVEVRFQDMGLEMEFWKKLKGNKEPPRDFEWDPEVDIIMKIQDSRVSALGEYQFARFEKSDLKGEKDKEKWMKEYIDSLEEGVVVSEEDKGWKEFAKEKWMKKYSSAIEGELLNVITSEDEDWKAFAKAGKEKHDSWQARYDAERKEIEGRGQIL